MKNISLLFAALLYLSTATALDWSATTHQNVITPSKGGKKATSPNTQIKAPFSIESHEGSLVTVDFGKGTPNFKVVTILDEQAGPLEGKLVKVQKVCEKICPGDKTKLCHNVGVYRAPKVKNPLMAIPGSLKLQEWERPVFKDEASHDSCRVSSFQNFTIAVCADQADLFFDNNLILSAFADYNDPKVVIMGKFKLNGTLFYLLKVGLKPEDSNGLLFRGPSGWEFLYRTLEPSERITICDGSEYES